jgi:hypothetical protein
MTSTDMVGGSVASAKAKIDATHREVLTFVPRILDAHKKAEEADKLGFQQSLVANIALGEILAEAKAATKGKFKWGDWRAEHIPQITQTKASLCIRLYKGKDRLLKPSGEDGKRISDTVATLLADNKMSVRRAAALLVTRKRTNPPTDAAKRTDETVGREWLKVLAADELVAVLRQDRGIDYLKELMGALGKVLDPPPASTGPRRV